MKLLLLFSGLVLSVSLVAQYPSGGIKSRLGWQTTGDGLVYRGSGAPAYSPGTMFNAWMYLDTTNFILYAYKNFQWTRLPLANNGLNFDGAYAQLGGTLIENTTVETSTYDLLLGRTSGTNHAWMNIFGSGGAAGLFNSYQNGDYEAEVTVTNGTVDNRVENTVEGGNSYIEVNKDGFDAFYLHPSNGVSRFKMDSTKFQMIGLPEFNTHALASSGMVSNGLYKITNGRAIFHNLGAATAVSPNIQDNNTSVSILNSKPFQLGTWTTAGRPTGVTGYIGRNTTLGVTEEYNGSAWDQFAMLTKTQTFTGVNSFNNDIYLNNALKQNTITAYTLNYLNYEAQSTNHGVILKFDANGIPTDNMYGMEFNGKASGVDLPGLLMIGSNSSKKIVFAQRNLGTSPQNYDLVFKNVAGDWWTGQDQFVIKQGGQVIVGTSTPITSSIFGVRSTTSASSPFPLQTATEANAIAGVQGNFQYETTANGLRWHNGTRSAYAPESTSPRFTAGSVLFANTNGQIAQNNSSFFWDNTNFRLIIGGTSGARSLNVIGEARISDLTTDTPTRIVGADADGDLGAITLGSGLSLSGGELTSTSSNIYIANGSLTENRTLHGAGYTLNINANTVFRDSVTVGNLPEFTPEYIAIADNTTGLIGKKKWIMPSANVYDGTSSGYFLDNRYIGGQVSGAVRYGVMYSDTSGYFEIGGYRNSPYEFGGVFGTPANIRIQAIKNGKSYSFISNHENGLEYRKDGAFSIFKVDTIGVAFIRGYGQGNREAADLSKTQSNYVAGLATDGTITDLALGSGLGITSGNLVTNQVLGEQFNEITSTSSPQTLSSSISDNLINQGGTQASFTLNFPASPVNGQILKITYNNAITSLTLDGNGNTIVGTTVTTAVAGSQRVFKFYTGIGWIRQN